jgi:(2Fe-2S) ferredoxin
MYIDDRVIYYKMSNFKAREMAQWLIMGTALVEDLGSISRTMSGCY